MICPDQQGIIARLTSVLFKKNVNILSMEQYVDSENKKFYARILTESKIAIPQKVLSSMGKALNGVCNIFNPLKKINVAILGTKEIEPIYDLLIKYQSDDLAFNNPIIISNHKMLQCIAEKFNVPFFRVTNNDDLLKVLKTHNIKLLVLARYMQIIPNKIIKLYNHSIINIHHGFLPAFKGAKPYHQAHKKGVKIIGATAHYATDELDEGPIIVQDTIAINHTYSVLDLIKSGREIEKNVLYKAVKAHLDYKIIVSDNKTIVFN